MPKKPYQEGDVLLVPLHGGYGVGVVARMATSPRRGTVWGYFFLSRELPTMADLATANPDGADLRCIFGDLEILRGRWQVLGRLPGWDRTRWPMLELWRKSGEVYAIVYDPDDPSKELINQMRPVSLEEARLMPEDGLLGGLAVEDVLQRLLDAQSQVAPAPRALPMDGGIA